MYTNKQDQAACSRRHYLRNTAKIKERAKTWTNSNRRKVKRFIRAYKVFFGCQHCGINDYRVLDLHHLRNKEIGVSIAAGKQCWSLARVVEELEKCIVLCANCHRIETVLLRGDVTET